jgi:CRP-like cAMP-binding protein
MERVAVGSKNLLLNKLSASELEQVSRDLQDVELAVKKTLYEPGQAITAVYFVTDGVVSMVNEPDAGEVVEFATVGREGMVGFPVLLGTSSMPSRTIVQVPGAALKMQVPALHRVIEKVPKLSRLLLRHTMAVLNQIAQTTSCNRLHEVDERCARWLLQTHDRVDGDSLLLTQEFLAQMLGCHRPTVTVAAGMLQQAGLIEYSRGVIKIVDRKGLEKAACNCYRIIAQEYERLLNGKEAVTTRGLRLVSSHD